MNMKTGLVFVALLAVATGAQADIVNGQKLKINFANFWQPAPDGDAAGFNYWNHFATPNDGFNNVTGNTTDMIDSTGGAVSGVSLTAADWDGNAWNGGAVWAGNDLAEVGQDQSSNFWWGFGGETITIQGLDAGLTYNVRAYALEPNDVPGAGVITEISLNESLINGGMRGDRWVSTSTPYEWTGMSAANGNLAFTVTGPNPVINAIVIEAIPEPATLGLVALFGGGIVFIRKRLML